MKMTLFLMALLFTLTAQAIIDGEIIENARFRQSVALTYKSDSYNQHAEIYCSGTLIGPRLVITAAHCIRSGAKAFNLSIDEFKKKTWVYLGETHQESDLPFVIPQIRTSRIELHPLNDSIYSDVAVIELSENIDLMKWGISPAAVLIPTHQHLGLPLTHVGYGQIVNGGVKGSKAFFTLPLKELNGYNGLGVRPGPGSGASACHGDSGGSAYLAVNGVLKFVGVEYGISHHPCGNSATYFVPMTEKILNWITSLGLVLFH